MNHRKANWMAIMAGAGVLCSAAWVLAEETAAPAAAGAPAPAAETKTEIKPEVTGPGDESPLARLQGLTRESAELNRALKDREASLLTEKPDLQKKLDAADEKITALQAEMTAAQASKQSVFSEADPALKPLYERQAQLRAELRNLFSRRSTGQPGRLGPAPAATPHVHAEGEATPAAK